MTPAPNSTLVERVATIIEGGMRAAGAIYDYHEREVAEAVIAACHVEELAEALCAVQAAISSLPVVIFNEQLLEAVERSNALLTKLDGLP